jgi:alcohol dehydrogenase (cytochrome c)
MNRLVLPPAAPSSISPPGLRTLLTLTLVLGCLTACRPQPPHVDRITPGEPTDRQLVEAQDRTDSWMHYSRNYAAWRFFPGDQINRENVKGLTRTWTRRFTHNPAGFETTPIIYDGIMYLTLAQSQVLALDAETGEVLWTYDPMAHFEVETPDDERYLTGTVHTVNRGLAISGDKLYLGAADARVICLSRIDGTELWDRRIADKRAGYMISSAPLVVGDKVISGVSGTEFGIRGFLIALDKETGHLVWKFNTIPEPGTPGSETWEGDSWKYGGGSTWLTGSYDPELNLLYWGSATAAPDFYPEARPGDNLFTNCILALNPDNGELVWYFQTTPHDMFDWDAVSELILIDEPGPEGPRRLLYQTNRNGYLYSLDRETGEFNFAAPYIPVNWAYLNDEGIPTMKPEVRSYEQSLICPTVVGGTNWPPAAYSPLTHLIYVPVIERCMISKPVSPAPVYRRGQLYVGFGGRNPVPEPAEGFVKALDPRTGEIRWSFDTGSGNWSGLLATGGGLVFGGAHDGMFRAFHDETGEVLWETRMNGQVFGPPISFELSGRQYVGVPTSNFGPIARQMSGDPNMRHFNLWSTRYTVFSLE